MSLDDQSLRVHFPWPVARREISKRRNELLREMFRLVQKRDNLGFVIPADEDDEEGLRVFLDRFDMEKQ